MLLPLLTRFKQGRDSSAFLFAIVATDEFDPWQPLPGELTGDGKVTQDDIDIIMANMGLAGDDLTALDGDVNGDGVVDSVDLAIAMDHLGQQLFDVMWDEDSQPIVLGSDGQEIGPVWRLSGFTTPCKPFGAVPLY